jgi:hypothetical protein
MSKNGSFGMWIILISAVLAVLLVIIPTAAAQTGTQLRYGDTVSGTIDEATPCQLYWFQGTAGDPVTIDLTRTSGDLDGNLALYQRDGNNLSADPVASNDDRPGGGLDPLINATLPATDWYTVAACRLQAERMRVTTGTYTLTLTGPQTTVAATPTPSLSLSNSIFGEGNAKPTPSGSLPDTLSTPTAIGPNTVTTLADGSDVTGQLAAGVMDVRYDLPVTAGDSVFIEWRRQSGDVSPLLRVTDPGGTVLAESSTPDAVDALTLAFYASGDDMLALSVTRSGGAGDGTTGDYELRVSITPGGTSAAVPTPEATTEVTPDYLANPCTTGANAVVGLASSNRLIDVYTAAGDSYYADQLDRTTVFRTDDDLNVVFLVQNVSDTIDVAGVFCSPDNTYYDGGTGTFSNGGPYLVGVDWESTSVPWITADWYVEVYVNGQVELTLGFSVQ